MAMVHAWRMRRLDSRIRKLRVRRERSRQAFFRAKYGA